MNDSLVMTIAGQAMLMTAKLALPVLLVSMAVGLLVSLFQSVTSIQEVTLTFVPKLGAVALVLALSGHWMLGELVGYTEALFNQAATLVGS